MTSAPNAGTIWLAYNAAENARDFEAMEALVASDLAVNVNGQAAVSSVEDDAAAMGQLFADYPDYRREALDVIDEDSRAAIRWRMLGTPAAGADAVVLDVAGCSVVSVSDGRIVEAHLFYDGAALDAVLASVRSVPQS